VLIALDGTKYHVSSKVHCQQCSTRKRGKDKTEHFHALVSATLVAPEHNRVVPLEPEFIVPQDGHDKQDCEVLSTLGASGASDRLMATKSCIRRRRSGPAARPGTGRR
jgi:hypothetical protein